MERRTYIVHTKDDNIPVYTTCPQVAMDFVALILGRNQEPMYVMENETT